MSAPPARRFEATGSRFSLQVFAWYLTGMSGGLLLVPDRVLPVFGFAAPADFWVRVLGGILGILALYYFLAVAQNNRGFYRWTVAGRLPLILLYSGLVLFAGAPRGLLLFGVFESGCGLWTYAALRREARATAG